MREEPSTVQTAIRIANDLGADEIAGSPVARNALILLRQAIERGGLPLTATGNLSRAVVAEMCKLVEWPDYDQADAFRFNKVINEPDFLPLHIVRTLAQAATLVRAQRGKLSATPLGKSMLSHAQQGSLPAILFHIMFWRMDLGYFGRGVLGSWPQKDIGVVMWSLSVSGGEWQTSEKLTRICSIPEPAIMSGTWDRSTYAMEAKVLRPLLWFGLLEYRSEKNPQQPLRRAALLSEDCTIRSPAHIRSQNGFCGEPPSLNYSDASLITLLMSSHESGATHGAAGCGRRFGNFR